jgi:hypothetical protein
MVPRHGNPLLSAANRALGELGFVMGGAAEGRGPADSARRNVLLSQTNSAMRQLSDGLQIQLVSATGFAASGSITPNPL